MTNRPLRIKELVLLMLSLMLTMALSGCSLFQASQEELDQYVKNFVTTVDKAAVEAENGQKVLEEVRRKVDQEGLKKTKAQNTIINGADIAKSIKEEVIKSPLPKEMEPIREKFILSLDKRLEGYDQLFLYYDFLEEKYRESGDQLLQESYALFAEVKTEVEPFRK